jgi:hypothetical protein
VQQVLKQQPSTGSSSFLSFTMSASVASMKKWGIPDQKKSPETTLLERLVWVRYQSHWWPALLYHSYTELQQHLYDQLDMLLKAQFAMAIMHQMQDKRKVKVARLLGRSILEVIEVEDDCFCEFYWQLPNVLPKACKKSRYGDNIELYFDFHRALDQVEDIIREVSQENFALLPDGEQGSWLERAHQALDSNNEEDQSSVSLLNPLPSYQIPDIPKAQSMDSKSSSIATNDVGVWDNMMETITRSFDSFGKKEEEALLKDGKYPATTTSPRPLHHGAKSSTSPTNLTHLTNLTPERRSVRPLRNKVSPEQKQQTRTSSSSKMKATESMSRGSGKSKHSQAVTEKTGNRTLTKSSPEVDETRDPPSEGNPVDAPAASSSSSTALVKRNYSPINILPGLEGDDILPGLSQQVEGARDIWMNVLGQMVLNKSAAVVVDDSHPPPSKNTLPEIREEIAEPPSQKQMMDALAAEGTPQEEAEIALYDVTQSMSLWQRLTCATTEA